MRSTHHHPRRYRPKPGFLTIVPTLVQIAHGIAKALALDHVAAKRGPSNDHNKEAPASVLDRSRRLTLGKTRGFPLLDLLQAPSRLLRAKLDRLRILAVRDPLPAR